MRAASACLFVALSLVLAGCTTAQESLAFNEAVVKANKQLEEAGMAFGTSLASIFQGTAQPDAEEVDRTFKASVKAYKQVAKDMQELKVPESAEAKAFYEAHQKFLECQREIIEEDFAEIAEIATDETKDLPTKQADIGVIFNKVSEAEAPALKELQSAQRKFAEASGIRLE